MVRRLRRILLILLASLLGLVLTVFLVGSLVLRGSRPRLEGDLELKGLLHRVTVTRDTLGVPDIQAEDRRDAARALGFLHAQDRFFQMDLQRRNAAGELAALMGPALLSTDRDTRRHRFRMRAEQVVAATTGIDLEILNAYSAGVNSGLEDLKARPFEYLILRKKPEPWRPSDTVLTLQSMYLDLSLSTAYTEEVYANVRDNLPSALAEFLLPWGNRWEAPVQTEPVPGVQIPDATACNVRDWSYEGRTYDEIRTENQTPPRQDTAGSNNWAVAGALTGHGGALLANDMHLGHGLPNIWYRARMTWPEGEGFRAVVGVTLPGTPALVVGSNGEVAWGFTNSYGDWADLVILEFDPEDPARYRTPEGWKKITRVAEVIKVSGASDDTLWVEETIWGPIWTTDTKGRRLALRWTGHDIEAVNLNLRHLEKAKDVDGALAMAATLGIPNQNLVCADSRGRIAWTIVGAIPRRVGWDGRLPVSWADGTHRWDGYLEPAAQPRVVDPAEGRLWSANNRVSAGKNLALIGDGGYGLGARARQIRDDLRALNHPLEKDMLAVQLDDRARFMGEWRDLVLAVMEQYPPAPGSPSADFLQVVRDDWSGRADTGSVAYRLVRNFTYRCIDGVYDLLTSRCVAADRNFRTSWLPYRHAVTWEVLAARPEHLLPPWSDDWDDFVLKAVERTMEPTIGEDRELSDYTWGNHNTVVVAHPFTQLVPWLSRWLAAPPQAQPGDSFMPRVQHRRSGASERMVVSPGREKDGILHMPGGQSGHPLSPFFLTGHRDWVTGQATPLLPGPAEFRLELTP